MEESKVQVPREKRPMQIKEQPPSYAIAARGETRSLVLTRPSVAVEIVEGIVFVCLVITLDVCRGGYYFGLNKGGCLTVQTRSKMMVYWMPVSINLAGVLCSRRLCQQSPLGNEHGDY
jgi:hypothetical protein